MLKAALFIKGEESSDTFIQAIQKEDTYYFLECRGSYTNYSCRPVNDKVYYLTRDEVESMASSKRVDVGLATVANLSGFYGLIKYSMIFGAKASIKYYAGYTARDAAIGGVGIGLVAGTGLATTLSVFVDALDPFVHRDLALALDASTNNITRSDLEDIEAEGVDGITVVEVESLVTEQITKAFSILIENIIEDRD